jgi:hypothetical protein
VATRSGPSTTSASRCPVAMSEPLWACPACGRSFANRQQIHTCAPLGDVDTHFEALTRGCGRSSTTSLRSSGNPGRCLVLAERHGSPFRSG